MWTLSSAPTWKIGAETFQWNVSIIIFVVVDYDTYYLVYSSPDDPF